MALVAGFSLCGPASAADGLRVMIPADPGGGWDLTGRELGKAMLAAGALKNIRYENHGGAGGTLGLTRFAGLSRGDPDALIVGGMTMVGGVIRHGATDVMEHLTPVARLTSEYELIVVPADSPIRDLQDLMARFKADAPGIHWGGGSAGGTDHILVGLLAKVVGVDPAKAHYVAFKGGGEAVTAVLGGRVAVGVSGFSEFIGHVQSGRLRALAVTASAGVAGIPSLREQGIDVEVANWRGVFGAPGLSKAQQAALVRMVDAAVRHRSWKDALRRHGWSGYYLPGDAYGQFVAAETKRVGEILRGLRLVLP